MKYPAIITIAFLTMPSAMAQKTIPTITEVVSLALQKNPQVHEAALQVKRQSALKNNAFEIPKTDVSLLYGQYNSVQKNDNNVTVTQGIPFPTVFARQHTLNKMMVSLTELEEDVTINELIFQVKQTVNHLLYLKAREQTLLKQDSLLEHMVKIADLQYKTGEGTSLNKTIAETHFVEMKNQLARNSTDIQTAIRHIQLLSQSPDIIDVAGSLEGIEMVIETDSLGSMQNPAIALAKYHVNVADQQKKVESALVLPDLRIGYFNQTLIGTQNVNGQEVYYGSEKRFQGFQVGISLPLWFGPHASRVKAAELETQAAQKQQEAYLLSITQQYTLATQELTKNRNSLEYLRTSALTTADLISQQSRRAFESGELGYSALLFNLQQALSIREEYLTALYQYNNSIITLQYLNGNK